MKQSIDNPSLHEKMQQTKRAFFTYRNGILVDVLRRAGSPYKMIFGLNLPQISEIAAATGTDHSLAMALFSDRTTRESQLLAPMIADPDALSADDALELLTQAPDREAVDILCHRLLRRLPFAAELAANPALPPYSALRLAANLIVSSPAAAAAVAARWPDNPVSATITESLRQ